MQFAAMPTLRTERLILRAWREEDLDPFAQLNADPRVMEFFPAHLSREESDAMVGRIQNAFNEHGRCLWAVEAPGEAPFIGFVGHAKPRFDAPFTPATEIGWRLSAEHWGMGYASEAARAALTHGFETFDVDEIVAITVPTNVRSRAVMERLGMKHDPDGNFEHPLIPEGHPLRTHVLYRIDRPLNLVHA